VVSETKQTFVATICTAARDFIDSPILLKQLQFCPLMATTVASSVGSLTLARSQMASAAHGKVDLLLCINALRMDGRA